MWSMGWVKAMMKIKFEICQILCHLIIWCNHIVVECFEELMLLDKLHSLPWDLGIIWVSLCTYIGVLGMLPLATRAFHMKRQAFIVVFMVISSIFILGDFVWTNSTHVLDCFSYIVFHSIRKCSYHKILVAIIMVYFAISS